MQLGPYTLANKVFVAPMAGITDYPFRKICRQFGAGYAVSEMIAANPQLWKTQKSRTRLLSFDNETPRAVQILGADPQTMAECARYVIDLGAQIIDINMGCPAKKVCNACSGSALLKDERLVARILESVVKAVDVPVTLKYRTGWNAAHQNAVEIAQLAEKIGIAMLVLHGRTRDAFYSGKAEYDTIKKVKEKVSIPVVVNGDIDSPQKAQVVLNETGADAVMIGRAALGRPWIFKEISHYLKTGQLLTKPTLEEIYKIVREHLANHYHFYDEKLGIRNAIKHIRWYIINLPYTDAIKKEINTSKTPQEQMQCVDRFFQMLLKN